MPQLLTTSQVAEWLQVSEDTVKRWYKDRQIPYKRVGRQIRFDPEEIREWMKEDE